MGRLRERRARGRLAAGAGAVLACTAIVLATPGLDRVLGAAGRLVVAAAAVGGGGNSTTTFTNSTTHSNTTSTSTSTSDRCGLPTTQVTTQLSQQVTTTHTFGPQTILIGADRSMTFFVQPGAGHITTNTHTNHNTNTHTPTRVPRPTPPPAP